MNNSGWPSQPPKDAPPVHPLKALYDGLRERARVLEAETRALYFAFLDERTPWAAKAVLFLVLAYALSPLDLIPDFIPVIGYLDDLLIVPAGIALVIRMIPAAVMEDARGRAAQEPGRFAQLGRVGGGLILLIWAGVTVWIVWRLVPLLSKIHP